MGVCTAFVFAALVEFTFVNYLWRKNSSGRSGGGFCWGKSAETSAADLSFDAAEAVAERGGSAEAATAFFRGDEDIDEEERMEMGMVGKLST